MQPDFALFKSILQDEDHDANEMDSNGAAVIHVIAEKELTDFLEEALRCQCNINLLTGDSYGHAPLHIAVERKEIAMTKLLLDNGADVNAISKSGRTTMDIAKRHWWESEAMEDLLASHGGRLRANLPYEPASETLKIFLGHAGEEKGFARELRKAIEKKKYELNLDCFLDETHLSDYPGPISDSLTAAIDDTDLGVFLLSPNFVAKKWPMLELQGFLRRLKTGSRGPGAKVPSLFPVFFQLTTEECKRKDLLLEKCRYGFHKHGYFDQVSQFRSLFAWSQKTQETIHDDTKTALRDLCEFSGSKRQDHLSYAELADNIAKRVWGRAREMKGKAAAR